MSSNPAKLTPDQSPIKVRSGASGVVSQQGRVPLDGDVNEADTTKKKIPASTTEMLKRPA